MSDYSKYIKGIPDKYRYISEMPEIKEMESNKKGYVYTVIMIGVAAESETMLTLSDIYAQAKDEGLFDGITFTTVYAGVKNVVESKTNITIKNFIYQNALAARKEVRFT